MSGSSQPNSSQPNSSRSIALLVCSIWAGCQRTPSRHVSSRVVDAQVVAKPIADASVAEKLDLQTPDLRTPFSEAEAAQLAKDPDARWDRRLAAFSQLIAVHPDNAALRTEMAHAAYGQNDLNVAEDAARRALAQTKDPALQATALYQLGLVKEEQGELSSAADAYQQALRLKPHDDVQSRLAVIAQTTPDDTKFRVWLSGYAKKKGLYVQDSWSANLDDDPEREQIAILCNHDDLNAMYVVEDTAARRWSFIANENGSRHPHCGAGERGAKWRIVKEREIDLGESQHQELDILTVAIRNGQPAIIAQGYDVWDFEDGGPKRHDVALWIDWDKLLGSSQDNRGIYAWPLSTVLESRHPKQQHSIVPILMSGIQTVSPLSATVLQGRPDWRGPDDASLSLSAALTADRNVRLTLEIRDDVPVPPTLESPTTGDYVELQYNGEDLNVAAREDGTLVLKPGKRGWKSDLPRGNGSPGKIELLFPEPDADSAQGEPLSPYPQFFYSLSVKFHDRDKMGGRTESVLGFPRSLVLLALPSYARYPVPASLTKISD